MCEEPGVKGKRGSGVDCDAIMSKLYSVWLSEKGRKGVQVNPFFFGSVLLGSSPGRSALQSAE